MLYECAQVCVGESLGGATACTVNTPANPPKHTRLRAAAALRALPAKLNLAANTHTHHGVATHHTQTCSA